MKPKYTHHHTYYHQMEVNYNDNHHSVQKQQYEPRVLEI